MTKVYYGSHTKKALKNFPFSSPTVSMELIYALTEIKLAATIANYKAGNIGLQIKQAIVKACQEVLHGKLDDQFNLPALQGGAGTSINMNVNEVIANRASELLRRHKKDVAVIHPLDQVNRSQSTNDVNPSALKVASVRLVNRLLEVVDNMISVCDANGRRFKDVYKLGRTHLQDAVPTTLGAEFKAYADILRRDRQRLKEVVPYLLELNLGGTAIGNSINASPKYIRYVYQELRQLTKLQWKPALNFMAQTSSQTDFVMLSQSLTLLLMDASKVANDLRLLSSGPQGGLGEISLPELQEGSSIMPGKVNPVLPEAVNQLFFWGSGNDFTIRQAAAASQLELGVMSPIIADNLIRSLKLSIEVLSKFTSDCLAKVKPHRKRCLQLLEQSTAYATLLTPKLGYEAVSQLVHESQKTNLTLRQLVLKNGLMSDREVDKIVKNFKLV